MRKFRPPKPKFGDSRANDCLPKDVLIDRELRWLLEREGINLYRIATDIIALDYFYDPANSQLKQMVLQVGEYFFEIYQTGQKPAVLSTCALIGQGLYHGDELAVWQLLPQTICDAAVGRRLGDVIRTGIPAIDGRTITSATAGGRGHPSPITTFAFEPDLVAIGPPSP
ncbi:hypothetical protein ACM61V_04275 [Sphingomonas sp. TX0543]|uniref:hypothetical protein n=1 Tax=unclassified Sphingomonas TaxID=196159 RepID=UPI0014851D0E|nr:hypothetical protein [Sphingomonas sp. 3P27F8]